MAPLTWQLEYTSLSTCFYLCLPKWKYSTIDAANSRDPTPPPSIPPNPLPMTDTIEWMLSALCPCLGDSELNGWEETISCRAIGFLESVWDMGPSAQARVGAGAIHLPRGGLGMVGLPQEGEMDGTVSQ